MAFPEFRDLYDMGLPRDVVNIVRDYCCYDVWRDNIDAVNREYHDTWGLMDKRDILYNRKRTFLLNDRKSTGPYVLNVFSFTRRYRGYARLPPNYF